MHVGDVDSHALEDVVIDDAFGGGAAVGRGGGELPVLFPGAAGSVGGDSAARP